MRQLNCFTLLSEMAMSVDRIDFAILSEEAKLQVTDDVLTGLMKFITDKYNALDFKEIEKSAGDIAKFKYTQMLRSNAITLKSIYMNSPDSGADKYVEVILAIEAVMDHLTEMKPIYMEQYQTGNGLVQILYNSLVAAAIYSTGILVTNTIRFVTTEGQTDCRVLYDEIPGTIKHVHIANILAAYHSIETIESVLRGYAKSSRNASTNEAVSTFMVGAAVAAGVIMMIPRIIVLIREIIYSVYFNRVKLADQLSMQVELINTNIESLEAGRGNKKIIARQKRIVDKLEKWKNRLSIKNDTVNSAVLMQKNQENAALRIDRNSPILQSPGNFSVSDLMI